MHNYKLLLQLCCHTNGYAQQILACINFLLGQSSLPHFVHTYESGYLALSQHFDIALNLESQIICSISTSIQLLPAHLGHLQEKVLNILNSVNLKNACFMPQYLIMRNVNCSSIQHLQPDEQF